MKKKSKEKSWQDPIIADIHAKREALVEECGNDVQAVFDYYLKKQKEEALRGTEYVNFPSKPVEHPRTGTDR